MSDDDDRIGSNGSSRLSVRTAHGFGNHNYELPGRHLSHVRGVRRPLAGHTTIPLATGAAFPLFVTQMFLDLGTNWAATLLGGITLLLVPIPFHFYKYGPRIRTESSFAPCTADLKVTKLLEEQKATSAE
jgi:hypothetical protein